jgi:hypothetical protein
VAELRAQRKQEVARGKQEAEQVAELRAQRKQEVARGKQEAERIASAVRKRPFAPFMHYNDHFTKTGSG